MWVLRTFVLLLVTVLFSLAAASASQADTQNGQLQLAQSSSGGLLLPGNSDDAVIETGWWTRLTGYITRQQQKFYRALAGAIKAVEAEGSLAAAWGLVFLSFLYGVFHAAGPGHGKAVISAYLLADERLVRRGIALAFAASFLQAISAIVLVTGAWMLVATVGKTATALTTHLESASYALICLIGLYMLWSTLRGHSHGHAHAGHDHGDDHDHHGHSHMPTPAELDGAWSPRKAASIAFAVGLRPCSGAILVLVFAFGRDLYLAGIGATFAMSLGTAITVSAIATVTVYSKALSTRLLGADSPWVGRLFRLLAVVGSLAIVALGGLLLWVSLTTDRPLL
jgi:ABC-type nickel/cobalt efflux system permease component RcnA